MKPHQVYKNEGNPRVDANKALINIRLAGAVYNLLTTIGWLKAQKRLRGKPAKP
jgi:hypothetical protein